MAVCGWVGVMASRGVWIMGPTAKMVGTDFTVDQETTQRIWDEAQQSMYEGGVRVVGLDGERSVELFPIETGEGPRVVAVFNEEDLSRLTLAALVHDTINLLAIAQGHLDLQRQEDSGPLAEAMWTLARVENLVRKLGSWPRKEDGEAATAVAETLHHLSSVFSLDHYRLKWDLVPVPKACLPIDDFIEVFQNLLFNAKEAMPDGGLVTIAVYPADSGIHISITDSGVGMDSETKNRCALPYTTSKSQGRGLGLYRARQLMEQYQGRMTIQSAGPGQGTTVSVWLPSV